MMIQNRGHIKQWIAWGLNILQDSWSQADSKQSLGHSLGHRCGILHFGCLLQSCSSFLCNNDRHKYRLGKGTWTDL